MWRAVGSSHEQVHFAEHSGTYIGIRAFSPEIVAGSFDEIGAVLAEGGVDEFLNIAVQRLADRGLRAGFTLTGCLPWAEIDDAADLRFATRYVFRDWHGLAARVIAAGTWFPPSPEALQ